MDLRSPHASVSLNKSAFDDDGTGRPLDAASAPATQVTLRSGVAPSRR
jgi:hypothetical protein